METNIVFTFKNGCYLGDHASENKDWFHKQPCKNIIDFGAHYTRYPLSVSNSSGLVVSIKLIQSFFKSLSGAYPSHLFEYQFLKLLLLSKTNKLICQTL